MLIFVVSRYRSKTKMAQNYGLGRGLSSLIPSKNKKINEPQDNFNYFGSQSDSIDAQKDNQGSIIEIDVSKIVPNPHQPRKFFDETRLLELAESIKEYGVIQPIVVSKFGEQYEIIAGERRFQASKIAGLFKIPAIVRKADDRQKLELAIIENIQRQDLNFIEEAKSYLKLVNDFGLTQDEVAKKIGKSRSAVANKIRLLNLPVEIQKALISGKITEGHCKLLLAIPNLEKQRAFYEMIIKNSLTVRQTENKAKEISVKTHKRNIIVDPETKNLEDELSNTFSTKVKIKKSGFGGQIIIEYYSKEELGNILDKIK